MLPQNAMQFNLVRSTSFIESRLFYGKISGLILAISNTISYLIDLKLCLIKQDRKSLKEGIP